MRQQLINDRITFEFETIIYYDLNHMSVALWIFENDCIIVTNLKNLMIYWDLTHRWIDDLLEFDIRWFTGFTGFENEMNSTIGFGYIIIWRMYAHGTGVLDISLVE